MPDMNGNLMDGDRAAMDQVKSLSKDINTSWPWLCAIAVGSGVAYGFWPLPGLLSATIVFVGWAVISTLGHLVQVATGMVLSNASRLQVIEGKIDAIIRDREAYRTAR
jgi:hypothetical protein